MKQEFALRGRRSTEKMSDQINSHLRLAGDSLYGQWVKRAFNDRGIYPGASIVLISLGAGYTFASAAYVVALGGAIYLAARFVNQRRPTAQVEKDIRENELSEIKSRLGQHHRNLADSMTIEKNRLLTNWRQFQSTDFPFAEQTESYEREACKREACNLILLLQERRIEIDRLEQRDLVKELDATRARLKSMKSETAIREGLERRERLLIGQQSALTELNNSVELIELQIQNIADFYSLLKSKTVAMPGETTIELKGPLQLHFQSVWGCESFVITISGENIAEIKLFGGPSVWLTR